MGKQKNEVAVVEKKFQMRGLMMKDIYSASKILKKMKLKIEPMKMDDETGKKIMKTQEEFGAELIMAFIENLGDAEQEVNKFMASLIGIEESEFSELDLEDSLQVISLFKQQKGIKGFLQQVSKLNQ